jgi:hypothetical protein
MKTTAFLSAAASLLFLVAAPAVSNAQRASAAQSIGDGSPKIRSETGAPQAEAVGEDSQHPDAASSAHTDSSASISTSSESTPDPARSDSVPEHSTTSGDDSETAGDSTLGGELERVSFERVSAIDTASTDGVELATGPVAGTAGATQPVEDEDEARRSEEVR